MNRVLALSTLLSVLALSLSALNDHHNNRYGGAPYSRNSLNYRGGNNRYSAPRAPNLPHSPSLPHSPRLPQSPRLPVSQSYGSQRGVGGYGGHQSAPLYGGGARHFHSSGSGLNQYQGPAQYGGQSHYAGPVHASAGGSHFSSAKRSVYQPQDQSYGSNSRSGFPHQQNYAQNQQHAQSSSQSHGREMKYTIRDPQNRGTTHVTETHVVSNKQMHGAEAEAAMKKLMGNMGPGGSDGGFNDFVKGMGIPFY